MNEDDSLLNTIDQVIKSNQYLINSFIVSGVAEASTVTKIQNNEKVDLNNAQNKIVAENKLVLDREIQIFDLDILNDNNKSQSSSSSSSPLNFQNRVCLSDSSSTSSSSYSSITANFNNTNTTEINKHLDFIDVDSSSSLSSWTRENIYNDKLNQKGSTSLKSNNVIDILHNKEQVSNKKTDKKLPLTMLIGNNNGNLTNGRIFDTCGGSNNENICDYSIECSSENNDCDDSACNLSKLKIQQEESEFNQILKNCQHWIEVNTFLLHIYFNNEIRCTWFDFNSENIFLEICHSLIKLDGSESY